LKGYSYASMSISGAALSCIVACERSMYCPEHLRALKKILLH